MDKKWYAIHTISGQEARVKDEIERAVAADNMQEQVGKVLLPTQEIMVIKNGKKVKQSKKFFPGYLLVEMNLTKENSHFIINVPGVTNFVGKDRPTPLRKAEIDRILGRAEAPVANKAVSEVPFKVGEAIKIKDGPFKDFDGTVGEINIEKGKLKVMVSVFGRLTPVEVDFLQVSTIE
jgi:transcription termination/antitermination protein NusG